MKAIRAVLFVSVVGLAAGLQASDRTGVYAVIDKVVFEPNTGNPQRVQIWGAFAVATPRKSKNVYDEVRRGYLYLAAGDLPDVARQEWNDLKALAGSGKIAAFSSRFNQSVRVRAAHEKPQGPDTYLLNVGVQVVQADRDYAPIKALAAQIRR